MNLTHAEKGDVCGVHGRRPPANADAAEFILREVAPALPDKTFVIFRRGRGGGLEPGPGECKILGMVDDERKVEPLAGRRCVEPVFRRSGRTSRYRPHGGRSAGPVLSRSGEGIDLGGAEVLTFSDEGEVRLDPRPAGGARRARQERAAGRRLVEERHSWEAISRDTGMFLGGTPGEGRGAGPSVIVPFTNDPSCLRLSRYMAKQTFTDFEVVIVDQSRRSGQAQGRRGTGPSVLQTRDGVARARNLGLSCQGLVLALDDDCEPSPNWLATARPWFDDRSLSGLEAQSVQTCAGTMDA